jgi:uncharacterized protein (TIGR04551 family)
MLIEVTMTRPASLALAAFLLLAGNAEAQAPAAPATPLRPLEKPAAAPAPSQAEIDRQIQESVQREVAKMREQLRDEVRAEIQGAQSAAEFLGEQEEKKKLQLLELNGYFRFRYDLFVNMAMGRDPDPMGYYLWLGNGPISPAGTQTSANMRLRVEPTFNVSEQVRIKAEIDILDNIVMGQNPAGPNWNQVDFSAWSQIPPTYGYNASVNAIEVKRAWGEVQTAIGLLSFGRMPTNWGMGIYANAGGGIDQEFGDSVDRIQFAIPIGGVLGGLAIVPFYDWASVGITSESLYLNVGLGQPVNVTQDDDVGAIGVRVVREDTPEQARRKLEKDLTSLNYGLLFNYKTQRFAFPSFSLQGRPPASTTPPLPDPYAMVKRDAYSLTFDLFGRWVGKRFELEAEAVGIFGSMANISLDPATSVGPVDLQMAGGALRGKYKLGETGRFVLGAEIGVASGDKAPGFGNFPGRSCDYTKIPVACTPPPDGSIDGQQWANDGSKNAINNYRFNPAYQVDLILWRRLLGTVTDAWYLKPSFRWDVLEGLSLWAQIVYSQAIYASSTPSTDQKPLGVELDVGVKYRSDDGFVFFLEYGVLQPMNGLAYLDQGAGSLGRAQNLHGGLGIVF